MRFLIWPFLLFGLACPAHAGRFCPSLVGYPLSKAAWPTAIFRDCEYERREEQPDGSVTLLIKITAESRLPMEGLIWARLELRLRDGELRGLTWRDHNALVGPGKTSAALLNGRPLTQILADIDAPR